MNAIDAVERPNDYLFQPAIGMKLKSASIIAQDVMWRGYRKGYNQPIAATENVGDD